MTKHILVLCVLLFGALLAYSNSVHNDFVLDDRVLLSSYRSDSQSFSRYFNPRLENFCYRPLLHLVLAVEQGAFGWDPAGYHIISVILLCAVAFLFYLVILSFSAHFALAFAAAVLFLLHPFNTTLVNYISTVNMLVLAVCALACILVVLNRGGHLWSAALFLLALLCHESALVLPLYTTAVLVIKEKNFGKEIFQRTGFLWGLAVVYFLWRLQYASLGANIFAHFSEFQMGISQYLAAVAQLIWWYVIRLLIPSGLVFTWGVPVPQVPGYLGMGFVVVLAAAIYFMFRRGHAHRPLLLGLAWFVIGLILLAAGCLAKPKWDLIIEPYWLLFSLMGFALALAWVGVCHARAWILIVVLAALWIWTDRIYNDLWSDEKAYCHFWLGEFPRYNAIHTYLANIYDREQNFAMVSYHNRLSLTSHPLDQLKYYSSEGVTLIKAGRWLSAKPYLQRAFEINPHSALVLRHLGIVALYEDNKPQAREFFLQALREDPQDIWSLKNLENMDRQ